MRVYAVPLIFSGLVLAVDHFAAIPVDGLIPRYFLDRSFPLAKRVGGCSENSHPCEETGHSDQCCDNDSYCYVSSEGDPRCCPIGSNCVRDTECSSEHYFCTQTTTISGSSTEREGCCPRLCPATSQYLCPEDEGGKCCNYNSECRAGNCVETIKPTASDLVTPIAEGCTTSQYRCQDGEGCCDNDQSCTEVSGTGYCASGRPTETGLTFIDDEDDSAALSDGAKAGIAVGAVVGAALIVGVLAWLCIGKRRERRRSAAAPSGGSSGAAYQQHEDAARMTEISTSPRPQPGRGPTQDYFGPDPVAGPYTEHAHEHSSTTSPGWHRAVPSRPEQPGDIAAPVEIDSDGRTDEARTSPMNSPSSFHLHQGSPPYQNESISGRFELYGSVEVEPPPRSPSIMQTPEGYKGVRSKKDG